MTLITKAMHQKAKGFMTGSVNYPESDEDYDPSEKFICEDAWKQKKF